MGTLRTDVVEAGISRLGCGSEPRQWAVGRSVARLAQRSWPLCRQLAPFSWAYSSTPQRVGPPSRCIQRVVMMCASAHAMSERESTHRLRATYDPTPGVPFVQVWGGADEVRKAGRVGLARGDQDFQPPTPRGRKSLWQVPS